ncbi:hypothetical protein CUMW_220800, partial [Citrus unshiu]
LSRNFFFNCTELYCKSVISPLNLSSLICDPFLSQSLPPVSRDSFLSPHLISLTLSSTLLHGEALFVSSLISITHLIFHSVAASKKG